MISSGDYVFQWANFIGVNISVLGSVVYTYVTFTSFKLKKNSKMKSRTSKVTFMKLKELEKKPLVSNMP